MKNNLLNYFGQLRIYSLADLVLLLAAAGASGRPLWGAVFLQIGFLAYLESAHHHEDRSPVPEAFPWVAYFIGLRFFGHGNEAGLYIIFSSIYALKKRSWWGLVSPIARGAQTFVLLLPFLGVSSLLLWVAVGVMVVRNILGDMRDVEQDRQEEMHTWPVALGLRHDLVFVHLLGVLGTTWLWWSFSSLPIWMPVAVNVIEISTYWLTPRLSNKKAAEWLRSKIL